MRLLRATRVTLYLIAAFWVVFGAMWLFRESDYRWFYFTGAIGNAVLLTMLTYLMSRGSKLAYWLLVCLMVANIILTLADQIGWFDIAYLLPAIAVLIMLLRVRKINPQLS